MIIFFFRESSYFIFIKRILWEGGERSSCAKRSGRNCSRSFRGCVTPILEFSLRHKMHCHFPQSMRLINVPVHCCLHLRPCVIPSIPALFSPVSVFIVCLFKTIDIATRCCYINILFSSVAYFQESVGFKDHLDMRKTLHM